MTVVLGIHDRTVVVTPDTPQSARCWGQWWWWWWLWWWWHSHKLQHPGYRRIGGVCWVGGDLVQSCEFFMKDLPMNSNTIIIYVFHEIIRAS